ncbi:Uma2 family endonuclease [Hyalangium minutum]|uniref:Putative restriction endonuclease domain-containing protein n=1 Tax=Hyalangium minutum TaxID=394096 RepID=A0A085W5J7_9BACT|nr:Uma2 family endonuclease [Hyalangium minutum]KFE62960.1 hypothetical protein DB31_3019 [Hyalangium minutum]
MGKKPATYADLEALPENVMGELINGELHVSPRPATPHTVAASRVGAKLVVAFDEGSRGPGGWIILFKPEPHFGEDVLVSELAGWRRERLSRPPRTAALTLAPDWVCEVLSPSTSALDRGLKLPLYARQGVRHVWLMDPEARTLEVFRLEGTRYVLLVTHTGLARVRAEPFEALELDLAYLWGER